MGHPQQRGPSQCHGVGGMMEIEDFTIPDDIKLKARLLQYADVKLGVKLAPPSPNTILRDEPVIAYLRIFWVEVGFLLVLRPGIPEWWGNEFNDLKVIQTENCKSLDKAGRRAAELLDEISEALLERAKTLPADSFQHVSEELE